jgi:putative hydrolase
VHLILQVDSQYRKKASDGELPMIAPKRFNPDAKAWLPVMHVTKQGWHFTALFSNTARAHQLDRTHDWVVIYFYDDQHHESQHTVVTETHGDLTGQRVVRGRETECREFYASVK